MTTKSILGFAVCCLFALATTVSPLAQSAQNTLTVQTFDNCVAWNNLTGSGFPIATSNPFYDSGPNSLCGDGDGWQAYTQDAVGAGMPASELLTRDSRCWLGSNCMIHRFEEGRNPRGGGAAKFGHRLVSTVYYAYNWKYSANSRWRTGDANGTDVPSSRKFTPNPSHFKQIDINDLVPSVGPRFLQGFVAGNSCTYDVYDSSTSQNCNLVPASFQVTRPDTWYCTAVFVDIPNHIIKTWSDMRQPGVMELLQDQRVVFASSGQNKITQVQLHTNMAYAQGDNNPTSDDTSTNAGLSQWFIDNFVGYEQPPANVGCPSTMAGAGTQAPLAPTNLRISQLQWFLGLPGIASTN